MLLYTASGDSESSMGGLVRMSEPHRLQDVVREAVEKAAWSSNDPVRAESVRSGQGPEGRVSTITCNHKDTRLSGKGHQPLYFLAKLPLVREV